MRSACFHAMPRRRLLVAAHPDVVGTDVSGGHGLHGGRVEALQQMMASSAQHPVPLCWQPRPPHSPHCAGQQAAMPCDPGMPPTSAHTARQLNRTLKYSSSGSSSLYLSDVLSAEAVNTTGSPPLVSLSVHAFCLEPRSMPRHGPALGHCRRKSRNTAGSSAQLGPAHALTQPVALPSGSPPPAISKPCARTTSLANDRVTTYACESAKCEHWRSTARRAPSPTIASSPCTSQALHPATLNCWPIFTPAPRCSLFAP